MLDEPRPRRSPVLGDDQIETLITATPWLTEAHKKSPGTVVN
jgi:hypothetical protein